MAEPTCIHAVPQAADQLHGICIFCYRDRLGAARAENDDLREQLAQVEEWTHRFGAELSPSGKWTDSFGDGVRASKERVSRLLAAAKPAAQEGKETT